MSGGQVGVPGTGIRSQRSDSPVRTGAKVVYIAGWGRSGTTLLDLLLGQAGGFVSTGEVHYIWERGLLKSRLCGCGEPVRECPRWQAVFDVAFGGMGSVDAKSVVTSQRAVHTRHARAVLRAKEKGVMLDQYPYAGHLLSLYRGIEEANNARVIVDSSKYPTDAIIAAGLPDHETFVIHLVRNPRAVAFSWSRFKRSPGKAEDGGDLTRVGPVRSTMVWLLYNSIIGRYVRRAVGVDHYRLVQYERFVANPEVVLNELIDFVGENPGQRARFSGNVVELGESHTASGNPWRLKARKTEIKIDNEWLHSMPWSRRAVVSILGFPMLRWAGYGLRAGLRD